MRFHISDHFSRAVEQFTSVYNVSVQQINHLFAAISIAGYVRPCPHRIIFENFFFNFHFSFIINCIHFRNQPRDIFLIKMYFFDRETEF